LAKLQIPALLNKQEETLYTERQIALYRQRETAKRDRASRREADARVRLLNFELVKRIVLLIVTVGIGLGLVFAVLSNPGLLEASFGAAAIWGLVVASLSRWDPLGKRKE
jgi:hypothetical protein